MVSFFKRAVLFLLMNVAVLIVVSAVGFLLERYFGIRISQFWGLGSLAAFALVYGFAASFISLFISRWMAKRSYGIALLNEERLMDYSPKEQLVFTTVARIAKSNGIDVPEVGVYESEDPNAFATGATKNSALVAVSSGLLESMSAAEIEGVVGHEMAHILNGDMVTMSLLQGVMNAFVIFFARVIGGFIDSVVFKNEEGNGWGYFITVMVFEVLLGILANLVLMAFSRHREYRADEGASRYVGKDKMIASLKRLSALVPLTQATADGQLSALKIADRPSMLNFLSSHPPLEMRIANLESKHVF